MNIGTTTTKNISAIKKEITIQAKKPMPDSALWHQTTSWRHAEELYYNYPSIWKKLKKANAIPLEVILRTEK